MSDAPKRKPLPLNECSVLITGGTSGVGLASAVQFAEAGVPRIAINGRNAERGEQARKAILAKAPRTQVEFLAGDCNFADQAASIVGATHKAFGSVDVLVNSTVGPAGPKLFQDIPVGDIQSIVFEQMMAPLLTSRLVLPLMRERGGGAIINIASDAGKLVTPGESVIGAAMAAIIMFSRTLAIEAKRNGIRVNIITPSIIGGTLTYHRMQQDPFVQKLFGKAEKMAQLGLVEPDDLAALIVFLASPQAARLTGQAISVNGGISAA